MGKTKTIILSQEARAELDKAYRFGSCHRFRMRCKAVMMKAENAKMSEICNVVGYGKLAVYDWFKRYEKDGLKGLREKGGRGQKPLMSSADTPAVKEAVQKHRQSIKTAKDEWESSSGKHVSDSTFRRFLEVLAQDISV